ncbi:MAG: hypothetical protein KA712_20400 [Myxococcales bacterium]|nr:hypothetical protein [Myxococcales bacterium]
MNFDELLESYKPKPEPPAPAYVPPPPEPERPLLPPESLAFRASKPAVILFDVLALIYGIACFFTWNDVTEQPASPWLRRIDFLTFGFLTLYGLARGVFHRWHYRLRDPIATLNLSLGVSLFLFYGTVAPPGLLLRLSALYDDSSGEQRKYLVISANERGTMSNLEPSRRVSGYFTIADPSAPGKTWEIYVGREQLDYHYQSTPAYFLIEHHPGQHSIPWLNRKTAKPIYSLERMLGPEIDPSRVSLFFLSFPECFDVGIDQLTDELLTRSNAVVLYNSAPRTRRTECPTPHFYRKGLELISIDVWNFLIHSGYNPSAGTLILRCPDGRMRQWNLLEDALNRDELNCAEPAP